MSFQIKDFVSIVASMLNHMRSVQDKITDFNVGSAARTLVEAPAIEIDELYQQMFHGLKEAIPAAIYTSFDFDRLPAKPASGLIRVTITAASSDVVISAGTVFSSTSTSTKFASQADAIIPAGSTYKDVFVVAQTAGVSSNIVADLTFTLSPNPAGFVSATNAAEFSNGMNLETDDQRKWRFGDFIASLNHGTNSALIYGLKTAALTDANGLVTEYVKFATTYEPYRHDNTQPVAWVQCFIHNGINGASGGLLSRAADVINGYYDSANKPVPGWKAAGVKVDIAAATNIAVDVTGVLTALPGYVVADLISQAIAAIEAYLLSLEIGESAIRAEIIAAVMNIQGVYNFVMSVPSADTAVTYSQKAIPGTMNITSS